MRLWFIYKQDGCRERYRVYFVLYQNNCSSSIYVLSSKSLAGMEMRHESDYSFQRLLSFYESSSIMLSNTTTCVNGSGKACLEVWLSLFQTLHHRRFRHSMTTGKQTFKNRKICSIPNQMAIPSMRKRIQNSQ